MQPSAAVVNSWPARLALGIVLVGVVVALPAYPLGVLDGLPADSPIDLVAIVLLTGLVWSRDLTAIAGRRGLMLGALLLIAAGLRLASQLAYGPHGLAATYECSSTDGRQLRSQGSHWDPSLDFDGLAVGLGRRPLPTAFLNDVTQPIAIADRLAGRLHISWTGCLTPARDVRLVVETGAAVTVRQPKTLQLLAGQSYPLDIEAEFADLHQPQLRLLTADDGRPVPAGWFGPAGRSLSWLAACLAGVSWTVLLVMLGMMWRLPATQTSRLTYRCCGLVLLTLALGVAEWEFSLQRQPARHVLPADDYLLYESEARHLVRVGWKVDDGVAFHRCGGMRYYLAGAHLLLGESTYGVVMFQQALRGVAGLLGLALLLQLGASAKVGWITALGLVLHPALSKRSFLFWPDTLGTVLFLGLCVVAALGETRNRRWGLAGGLLAGLLGLFRANAISLVPAGALWLWWRRGWRGAVTFTVSAGLILALVPLRNRVVTGAWVPLPTEGAITAVLGSNIPRGVGLRAALTGDRRLDRVLRRGLRRLWEFESNPRNCFDPFDAADNVHVTASLRRIWLTYVWRYPVTYLGQVTERAHRWFFPEWDQSVFPCALGAVAAIAIMIRRGGSRATWLVVFWIAAYSAPFLLIYFEPRHRMVIVPELVVLTAWTAARCWNKWGTHVALPRWQTLVGRR
jgi:hypothetical protein